MKPEIMKKRIEERGYNVTSLADVTGVAYRSIWNFIKGRKPYEAFTIKTARAIENALFTKFELHLIESSKPESHDAFVKLLETITVDMLKRDNADVGIIKHDNAVGVIVNWKMGGIEDFGWCLYDGGLVTKLLTSPKDDYSDIVLEHLEAK